MDNHKVLQPEGYSWPGVFINGQDSLYKWAPLLESLSEIAGKQGYRGLAKGALDLKAVFESCQVVKP